jgi:hypothetical protein
MNTDKSSLEVENQPYWLGAVISRFGNFLYWFIHNEVATPILVLCLIIFGFALAPFYIIANYFYRYYCRVNCI